MGTGEDDPRRGLEEAEAAQKAAWKAAGLASNGLPYKRWRVGYPMGHEINSKNDAATEALYDYAHATNLGNHPWAAHLQYRGSVRVESIRIDDNRNNICNMFLEKDDSEVLVFLDRDEIWPPDGVVQLVLTCTPELPVVSGVYFQRTLDNPYPHVYRHSHIALNKWGEESRHSNRCVEELYHRYQDLKVPQDILENKVAFRICQSDRTPVPEDMRLLRGAFGGTGLTAIHKSLLLDMKANGHPYFPWFRERGEKGDMAFFNKVQELKGTGSTAVDVTVLAGHIGEELIGVAHFTEVFVPAIKLADAIRNPKKIETVAVAMATIDPANAVKVIERVKETGGVKVISCLVDDSMGRRFGTRTLNDAATAALNTNCDAVLFLDDDIDFPQQGWLRKLCDALEEKGVGAVGPSLECRGIQAKPVEVFRAQNGDPDDMPFLCGAVLLIDRKALECVGKLDENLRHYHSDSDQCLALRAAGWRLRWVHEVKVDHKIAGAGFFPELWNSDAEYFNKKWQGKGGVKLTTTPANGTGGQGLSAMPPSSEASSQPPVNGQPASAAERDIPTIEGVAV